MGIHPYDPHTQQCSTPDAKMLATVWATNWSSLPTGEPDLQGLTFDLTGGHYRLELPCTSLLQPAAMPSLPMVPSLLATTSHRKLSLASQALL
eukprot:m.399965 g.399965  ORF g.399965 m.399965 type:complete len:93 (-) comp20113_c1_seq85:302-580(-)